MKYNNINIIHSRTIEREYRKPYQVILNYQSFSKISNYIIKTYTKIKLMKKKLNIVSIYIHNGEYGGKIQTHPCRGL